MLEMSRCLHGHLKTPENYRVYGGRLLCVPCHTKRNASRYTKTKTERPTPEDRFHGKYVVAPNGCWIWISSVNAKNYGQLYVRGRLVFAHRFSYELHVGPISDGLEIDHLCRVTLCVNWRHLEQVTARENTLRGFSPSAIAARKAACVNGHEYTAASTYFYGPYGACRRCRTCDSARHRAAYKPRRQRV